MKRTRAPFVSVFLVFSLAIAVASDAASAACPPQGESRASLQQSKAEGFAVADDARRQQLAIAMLDCLADPDPMLRDGIAFESLSAWLRGKQLDVATRRSLLQQLSATLGAPASDAAGFRRPFAALVAAEVARTDRVEPWLVDSDRAALVDTATRYLESIRDYRDFDAVDGWRHGVAHGADLLMQLALNPALDKAQLDRLLAAIASQVTPEGAHSYTAGEPERLARPVLFVALRGQHSQAEWAQWFERLARPAPLGAWSEAFTSREGLAQRHNLVAFLRAVYVGAREANDGRLDVMLPGLRAALQSVPD